MKCGQRLLFRLAELWLDKVGACPHLFHAGDSHGSKHHDFRLSVCPPVHTFPFDVILQGCLEEGFCFLLAGFKFGLNIKFHSRAKLFKFDGQRLKHILGLYLIPNNIKNNKYLMKLSNDISYLIIQV